MAAALVDYKPWVAAALHRLHLGIGFVAAVATPAFDFARYKFADLDDILARRV